MYRAKKRKSSLRLIALSLVFVMVMALAGCGSSQSGDQKVTPKDGSTASTSDQGLHKLTKEDVVGIFKTGTESVYQDASMKQGVKATDVKDIQLTEEEKQKIRGMNLKIGFELDHMADAMLWMQRGVQDVAKDLGITVKDNWIASAQNNMAQAEDYQRIEAIAQNYDAIFTLPTDTATSGEILKKIMKKTKVGFFASVPLGLDWNDPNYLGVSDTDAYQAGVYSAEAAIKILNGKGTIGTIGYINGKQGSVMTCAQRYAGWDKVLKANPNVKVVQKWFDNPAQSKDVISSLLASNPDIKVLLVDWSNPPADLAQQVFKERGLKPWKDISLVSIDLDNVISVPMAKTGPDNNYTGAFITQDWYGVGANMINMYAKQLLTQNKAPKYVVSPPLPVTTWNSLKTHQSLATPAGLQIPPEVMNLKDQWELDIEKQWKK